MRTKYLSLSQNEECWLSAMYASSLAVFGEPYRSPAGLAKRLVSIRSGTKSVCRSYSTSVQRGEPDSYLILIPWWLEALNLCGHRARSHGEDGG